MELLTDTAGVGQDALPLRQREGALERLARVVDPARALEHGRKVLVAPRFEDHVVRPFRRGDAGARERLRLRELATRGKEKRLDGSA